MSTDPEIEHFWTAVARGWDIEPRAYFEKEAVPMGFKSPVEMAVHHMWKRHAKDWPAAAAVPHAWPEEADRQMLLRALAIAALDAPGFDFALRNIASQIRGGPGDDGTAMYDEFKRLNTDRFRGQ